jgi:hypothetical protein
MAKKGHKPSKAQTPHRKLQESSPWTNASSPWTCGCKLPNSRYIFLNFSLSSPLHLFSSLLTMYESRWKCRKVRQSI